MSGDGFTHDKGALQDMMTQLRDGATALDVAIGKVPEMVDAGASSTVVAKALRDVLRTGSGAATLLEGMSEKIDATSGTYDDVENDNAGAMREEHQKSLAERVDGPL